MSDEEAINNNEIEVETLPKKKSNIRMLSTRPDKRKVVSKKRLEQLARAREIRKENLRRKQEERDRKASITQETKEERFRQIIREEIGVMMKNSYQEPRRSPSPEPRRRMYRSPSPEPRRPRRQQSHQRPRRQQSPRRQQRPQRPQRPAPGRNCSLYEQIDISDLYT